MGIMRWACVKKYWVTHEEGENYTLELAFNYDQNIPLPLSFSYKIEAHSNSEAEKVAKKIMDMVIQIGADSVSKKLFSSKVILDSDKAEALWKHLKNIRIGKNSQELTTRWLASFYN